MRRALCLLVVLTGLIFPGVAHASSLQNLAATAGIAQSDQSFDTLVFDYDKDGIPDFLYSPQNDTTGRQLWRGNPDGSFTIVTHLVGPVGPMRFNDWSYAESRPPRPELAEASRAETDRYERDARWLPGEASISPGARRLPH